ncbi:MAG TPA: long-chain fatty acid--CoA ligase, partial [Longimicrobiales bacterium]
LIYTSGTTGAPKGVMLTHAHLASMVAATRQHGSLVLAPGEVTLSILPLSHVFERAASYIFFGSGVTTLYAASMQTVPRDLAAVRPQHVVAVPRLFEKVYDAVAGAPALKGKIARWAARTAVSYMDALTSGRAPSAALRARHALADRLVFRVLRQRVGGRLKTFICGGAPLEPHIGALFHAAGMPIYEGYGLTETSPVIAANKPGHVRLGSAGVPYPGVEVRLGEQAEIQVRAPGVFSGYWQRPEASAAAFTPDGWFRTGDVGAIENGFLLVIDRLKELIVTAGGKNVAPQPLEQRVISSPLISQAVLLGDRRPYLVMLVVPEFAALEAASEPGLLDRAAAALHAGEGLRPAERAAAAMHELAGSSAERAANALHEGSALIQRLAAEVASCLHDTARVERPKRIAILPQEFTVDNGLLTPTLKVRRRAVERAYRELLDELYAGRAGMAVPWEAP